MNKQLQQVDSAEHSIVTEMRGARSQRRYDGRAKVLGIAICVGAALAFWSIVPKLIGAAFTALFHAFG